MSHPHDDGWSRRFHPTNNEIKLSIILQRYADIGRLPVPSTRECTRSLSLSVSFYWQGRHPITQRRTRSPFNPFRIRPDFFLFPEIIVESRWYRKKKWDRGRERERMRSVSSVRSRSRIGLEAELYSMVYRTDWWPLVNGNTEQLGFHRYRKIETPLGASSGQVDSFPPLLSFERNPYKVVEDFQLFFGVRITFLFSEYLAFFLFSFFCLFFLAIDTEDVVHGFFTFHNQSITS